MKKTKLTKNQKLLIRRYLIWCYKTTKEDLDRVDRYFTQLMADEFLYKQLTASKDYSSAKSPKDYRDLVNGFAAYMEAKRKNFLEKKFKDSRRTQFLAGYQYLSNRFAAIEKAVCYFLSAKELLKIEAMYEAEFTERILKAREHA